MQENKPMEEQQNKIDNNAILNVFKNEFSTTVNTVFVNSLGREVSFREVSVTEQKSLSKTMIDFSNDFADKIQRFFFFNFRCHIHSLNPSVFP